MILLLLFTGASACIMAQSHKRAYVDNVRMSVRNGKVYVTYDLVDREPDRVHEVILRFQSKTEELINPASLSGDFGTSLTDGRDKTIIWDVHSDLRAINGQICPQLILDQSVYSHKYYGGPENAWYSLIMPGLGDSKVADPERMLIKPYIRTISSWGMISLGIAASVNRTREEGHGETYLPGYGWYEDDLSYDATLEKRWVEGSVQYWLFRGDAEFFFAAGLAIWISDIIWVYSRGRANTKLIEGIDKQELSLVPFRNGLGISYRLSF